MGEGKHLGSSQLHRSDSTCDFQSTVTSQRKRYNTLAWVNAKVGINSSRNFGTEEKACISHQKAQVRLQQPEVLRRIAYTITNVIA